MKYKNLVQRCPLYGGPIVIDNGHHQLLFVLYKSYLGYWCSIVCIDCIVNYVLVQGNDCIPLRVGNYTNSNY